MTDAISALLEVLASHRFDVRYKPDADGQWTVRINPFRLDLARRILPDAQTSDFIFCRDHFILKPEAIERARKALEGAHA